MVFSAGCGGSIGKCFNTGNITAQHNAGLDIQEIYAAGICGESYGPITECYNTGNIKALNYDSDCAYAGGISAYLVSTINNCFNTGEITADGVNNENLHPFLPTFIAYSGGIVATEGNGGVSIKNSYNIGNIKAITSDGTGTQGYICGSANQFGTVSNCYGLIQDGLLGVGRVYSSTTDTGYCTESSGDLKKQSTFASFDFSNKWEIKPGNFPDLISLPSPYASTSGSTPASGSSSAVSENTSAFGDSSSSGSRHMQSSTNPADSTMSQVGNSSQAESSGTGGDITTLSDISSNISIFGSMLPTDLTLHVMQMTKDNSGRYEQVQKLLNKFNVIELFDISLSLDGTVYEPNNTVTVNIHLPASLQNKSNIMIAHIRDDGSITYITPVISNGEITFQTDSFSQFAVLTHVIISKTSITNKVLIEIIMCVVLLILTASAIIFTRMLYKRKEQQKAAEIKRS